MARAMSPLRYPGGKASMFDLTVELLRYNRLEHGRYVEPFAGGCGLALALLYGGHTAEIHINDLDPAIWSFWHCVLNETEALTEMVVSTKPTIEEWHVQRAINRAQDHSDPLALGFSAFFLNRTNRSGIIKGGGVIGGLNQTGNYKLDCRYNADDLSRRINRMRRYRDRITLTNLDAVELLKSYKNDDSGTFLFIDPPYFAKGSGLYTNYYKPDDHDTLSKTVLSLNCPWIVTYDDVTQIRELYRSRRQFSFDIAYSLQNKRTGNEIMVASKGLRIPQILRDRQIKPTPSQVAA